MEAMQQQQLIQSLGPAALGSPLIDPQKIANANSQLPMEESDDTEEA